MKNQAFALSCLGLFMGACLPAVETADENPLDGQWEFRQVATDRWMPASIPGTVHTDLLENGVISDPFFRTNEKDQQWVEKEDWEYRTKFQVESLGKNYSLIFYGLDTYADVFLNETLVLQANNMFRTWEIPCNPHLKKGENTLRIHFRSPVNEVLPTYRALDFQYPATNDQGEEKVSVFTRKAPYHYGWDWGPRFVTSGIWRPVVLKSWDLGKIDGLWVRQKELDMAYASVDVSLEVTSEQTGQTQVNLYLNDDPMPVASFAANLRKGANTLSQQITIENPKRWWPNGLGDAYLYRLRAELGPKGAKMDEKSVRFGLRTVKVIQEPDEKGTSFLVEVNGTPVFMKGANYIPSDNFLPRVSAEKYTQIIQSAKEANMNMLRVWGGGIYENDLFYDLCDENGILVWQDFMFACSMYPGDETFLENVKQEAIDNVKRLRNHASLGLWCGNNEILGAWHGWGWQNQLTDAQKNLMWKAYEDIFYGVLPEVVRQYDPDRFYWPSSPSSTYYETANLVAGDEHYWAVWHAEKPFSEYRSHVGRFMSEYGFQSFPEMASVKKYTLPEDHDITSSVMLAHQRHPRGNQLIRTYMARDYQVPEDFADFLYVGQLLQAEGIKVAIEAHRTAMPYCMGTLYWQLNDCWPVASWSGMDYYLKWKALHFFVKKAYQEILLASVIKDGQVHLNVVSDRLVPFKAILQIETFRVDGQPGYQEAIPVTISPNTSSIVFEGAAARLLSGLKPNEAVTSFRLLEEGITVGESKLYFVPPKDLQLQDPGLTFSITEEQGTKYVEVTARQLAKNVRLSFPEEGGRFSDNYFDVLPGKPVKVAVIKTPEAWDGGSIELFSLWHVGKAL